MNRIFSRCFSTTSKLSARGWRKYLHLLKERPASHLTAFAILHELTAILPFPLIYFPLKWFQLGEYLPLPMKYIQGQISSSSSFVQYLSLSEGNRRVNRFRTRYGYEPLDESSLFFVNLSLTYALVKVLLPVRIALSLFLTPPLASLLRRSTNIFRRLKNKLFSSQR